MARFASDLGQLYWEAQARSDRLVRLERGLVTTAEGVRALTRARSLEEAAHRLAQILRELRGARQAAVYLSRGQRLERVAAAPAEGAPTRLRVPPTTWHALETGPLRSGPLASELGGPAWVVVLPGRAQPVGLVACSLSDAPPFGEAAVISALARCAGALLEDRATRERRREAPDPRAGSVGELVGESPCMREVRALLERVARADSTVLLRGETGTGKGLAARTIHGESARAAGPFVAVNCAAIPSTLLESELFGHEAGAFTGATRRQPGRVAQAEGGTLFLDEIGELPLEAQSKLLGFLEERRYSRLGGDASLQADVRLLAATNVDLEAAVAAGEFRQDLLYRLDVLRVELPPLRARGRDVLLLAEQLGARLAAGLDRPPPVLDDASAARLLSYPWPGNVRELRNVLERALVLSPTAQLDAELIPAAEPPAPDLPGAPPLGLPAPPFDPALSFSEAKQQLVTRWETQYLESVLRLTHGNVSRAAREVGLNKKNLLRKIRQLGIDLEGIRAGG